MDDLTMPASAAPDFEPSAPIEPEPPEMADIQEMPSAMPAIKLPLSISQSELTVPSTPRERTPEQKPKPEPRREPDRSLDLTEPARIDRDLTRVARPQRRDEIRPAAVPAPAPVQMPPPVQPSPHQPIQQRAAPPSPPYQQYQPPEPSVRAPQPPLQQPMHQPVPRAVNRGGSRTRQNWTVVALAVLALVSTVMFGVASLVGVRLVNAGRELASAGSTTPAVTSLPTFDMPPPTVGVQIDPWNGTERFTVLMMGLDKRPGDRGTAFRTDSMIVISIDPAGRTVGLLSVPRDLYIEIPPDTVVGYGYGLQRVNSAYVIGELARTGYGAHLAMQTVQYNLGIRIHDYVVFDFTTVIDAINAVGGIDINVKAPINDPDYPNMYYGYEPLYIPAGLIHMDGELALKYARSRHGSSDFDRAKRQQEVITALRSKILDGNLLPELLSQAPNLWTSFSRSIGTGLTLDQMLRLAVYLKDIPSENIRQGVLDQRYVTPTMWDGASVLVPNRATIGPLLVEVFGANYNQ